MKITFPHLGNVCYAAKALFSDLGIDYVMPPFSSKTALEIGSLHSPEEICLPFKIMVGNYVQSIEQGADTILITGSCGPCRFGEYCEMQIKLLNKLGHKLEFIVIDQPGDIGVKELLRRISKIASSSMISKKDKFMTLMRAYKIINLIDDIDAKAHINAGYEKIKGQSKVFLNECKSELLKCSGGKEMIQKLKEYKQKFDNMSLDMNKKPLKIAIIGEIYTIIEPFSNLYIEEKLMNYGVCTKRLLTPSWWVKDTLMTPFKLDSLKIKRNGRNYLSMCIGGHAQECIGEAVLASKEGFDGAIQIFPMGCMPEIVSKAILPTIAKDRDFPIMSLVVDEMTGEAGYVTRIEAFLDLLERRKKNVLYGS